MSQFNTNLPNRRSIRLKGYDYSQPGCYFITICCQDRKHRFGEIQNGKMILNANGNIAAAEWEKLKERFPNIKHGAFVVMPNHIHFIIIITQSVVQAGLAPAPISTNNPVGAGFTPARNKTDDPARNKTDDHDNISGETDNISGDPAHNETGDREGRPNQYNGVGNEGDRKGRPNENDETVGAGLASARNDVHNNVSNEIERKITIGEIVGAYKSLVFNNCLKLAKEKGEYMGKFWQRDYFENIIRNDEAFRKITDYIINNPLRWKEDKFFCNNSD